MALTIEAETEEVLDIETFNERVARYLDPADEASVASVARDFRALANNREFIARKINADLDGWASFQTGNDYTAQTILLAISEKFVLRANIWLPPSENPGTRAWQNELFFYQVPHDHNFTFLTIGYLGAGYETTIWEHDRSTVTGYAGEKVRLRFLERTTLPRNKIMLYRAGRDVHSQEHPSELSLSLNVLAISARVKDTAQYLFDVADGSIAGFGQHGGTSQILVCRLAGYIGDSRSVARMEEIAARHEFPQVRAAALESSIMLCPGERESILKRAARDSSPYVRNFAEKALRNT